MLFFKNGFTHKFIALNVNIKKKKNKVKNLEKIGGKIYQQKEKKNTEKKQTKI